MQKIECLAINLGVITANDLERHTALELIMLIIDHLNEVIDKINHIDQNLLNQLRSIISELVDNGTISSLLADEVYEILNHRIGDKKSIEEYRHLVENEDWTKAFQQAFDDGVKTLVLSGGTYHVSLKGKDVDNRGYAIKIANQSHLTIEGHNGALITFNYNADELPNIFSFHSCEDVKIKGVRIQGIGVRLSSQPDTPLYTGSAFYFKECKQVLVESCWSKNVKYHAIGFNSSEIIVDKGFNHHDYYKNEPFQSSAIPYGFVQFHSCQEFQLMNSVHYGATRDGDVVVFGGGGEHAKIENNMLFGYGYNDSSNHTYHSGQAICNDQGSTSCMIRGNYIYGYYFGIDMKADVRNCICENNIVENCKFSIADRKGESTTVSQTQFNVIRGNKIIFKSDFEDDGFLFCDMYSLIGINCENRQGCWVENNELVVNLEKWINLSKPILGIYFSQEQINADYLYPSVIKGNNVVFTVANGSSVIHAPGGSTMLHIKDATCISVLNNTLKGSYSQDYFGVKCQGNVSDIDILHNKFWTSGNTKLYYTESDTTVTNLVSDINRTYVDSTDGIKEVVGKKETLKRIITPEYELSTSGKVIGKFLCQATNYHMVKLVCCADWSGLRYLNATYMVKKGDEETEITKIDGTCTGYTVSVENTSDGYNLKVTTDVNVPKQSFYIELISCQYTCGFEVVTE
nr:MAG TPA: Preneck appendage protein helix, VIRAL PROTEIN.05A [Caudoviricetes sp.]